MTDILSISRRSLLLAVGLAPLATACATPSPPPKDPAIDVLEPLARLASADVALARTLGVSEVANARDVHAQKLTAELNRITPSQSASAAASTAPATVAPGATAKTLNEALQTAQKQAADAVLVLPAASAGLVGSIAASCASLIEILNQR